MCAGDHEVELVAQHAVDVRPGSQETFGVLAVVAAGNGHHVAPDTAREHPTEMRSGIVGRRCEATIGPGADRGDPLQRERQLVGGRGGREVRDGEQRVDRSGERGTEFGLAASVRIGEVDLGVAVRDHVVHHGGHGQTCVGDASRDRVERDRVQHQLCGQVPGAVDGVVTHGLRAPALQREAGDGVGEHLGFGVGAVEGDHRCVDVAQPGEQPGDIAADTALAGGGMVDRTGVDQQRRHAQVASDPDVAASRSSSSASCRSITWVAPIAVSASRRNRSE